MSTYRVWGTVAGHEIDQTVQAATGADAIRMVTDPKRPKFGRDWRKEYREWWQKNVRLNAKQIA